MKKRLISQALPTRSDKSMGGSVRESNPPELAPWETVSLIRKRCTHGALNEDHARSLTSRAEHLAKTRVLNIRAGFLCFWVLLSDRACSHAEVLFSDLGADGRRFRDFFATQLRQEPPDFSVDLKAKGVRRSHLTP
jgi:hypothetical protein